MSLYQSKGVAHCVNVSEDRLFVDPGNWWIFINWHEQLDKRLAMHGVLLFCLRSSVELARKLGLETQVAQWQAPSSRA